MCKFQRETSDIKEYLTQCITRGGASKPMYISGMPGTGKTSCVLAVIKTLKAESAIGKIPMFEFVLINGMINIMLCYFHF